MSVMWDPGILGDDIPTANCRGCGTGIRLRAGYWEDASGITVCVKARLEDIDFGRRPDYVLHEPMPEGLVGAPQ